MKEQRSWGKTLSLMTTALSLVTGTTFLTASFPGSLFPPTQMIGAWRESENKATNAQLAKMHAEMLHSSTYHNVVESVGQDPVAVGEIVEVVLNQCFL